MPCTCSRSGGESGVCLRSFFELIPSYTNRQNRPASPTCGSSNYFQPIRTPCLAPLNVAQVSGWSQRLARLWGGQTGFVAVEALNTV